MVFEHIDKLKEEYTDKFVTVDKSRPELKRFDGLVGRVKTVNMSGRALVEFDSWVNNIGWYDIDIDFLKVVDAAEVAEKTAQAKAAPKKADAKPSKLEKSRESAGKPAAKAGAGMSMADILAAARGGTAPPDKEETELAAAKGEERPSMESGGQMSVADMLAAARASDSSEGAPAPAKKTESKKESAPAPAAAKEPKSMSVADMMAAARSADSGESAPAAAAPQPAKETPPAAKETPAAAPQSKTTKGYDTTGMTVEQMLALARDQSSGKAPPAQEQTPAPDETATSPAEEPPVAEEPEPDPEPTPAASTAAASPTGELPQDVAGIVAFCQTTDG